MEYRICRNCFVNLPITEFDKKRNTLELYKHCNNCRLIKKKSYENNKAQRTCPHGLYKYYCPTCKNEKRILKENKNKSPKEQIIALENAKKEDFFKFICTKIDEYYTTQKL